MLSLDSIKSAVDTFASMAHHAIPILKPARAVAIVESVVDFVVVTVLWVPFLYPRARRFLEERKERLKPRESDAIDRVAERGRP